MNASPATRMTGMAFAAVTQATSRGVALVSIHHASEELSLFFRKGLASCSIIDRHGGRCHPVRGVSAAAMRDS